MADDIEHAAALEARLVLLVNEAHRNGDLDLGVLAMRRKSTWIGRSLTGWNSTSFGNVRCGLPPKSIMTTEFMKWPVRKHLGQELLLDVDREGFLLFAVDHGGDAAFAAQCTGGSLASPFARLGRQRQLFAHFACLRMNKSPATPPGMTMAGEGAPSAGRSKSKVRRMALRSIHPRDEMPRSQADEHAVLAGEVAGADRDEHRARGLCIRAAIHSAQRAFRSVNIIRYMSGEFG